MREDFSGFSNNDEEKNISVGHYEDLSALMILKLEELLSHVKLLSNATALGRDYDILPEDVNALSTTLHDKTLNSLLIAQRLYTSLQELEI